MFYKKYFFKRKNKTLNKILNIFIKITKIINNIKKNT